MRLTRQEIVLIVSILSALFVGAVVKHFRDQRRLNSSPPSAAVDSGAATPIPGAE